MKRVSKLLAVVFVVASINLLSVQSSSAEVISSTSQVIVKGWITDIFSMLGFITDDPVDGNPQPVEPEDL